jgi:ATP-binding cassette subfamily B protein
LFTGTIENNIKYSNPKLSDKDMKKVAKISQSEEFISNLSGEYDYPISQGGTNVSGGQRQRLSIARALAAKSEVIIFDDSFSALDFKTDANLRKALKKEVNNTVIIVAQRISTIKDADKILVMNEGRIVGEGTHDYLLKNNKIYQEIAASQLSEEEIA